MECRLLKFFPAENAGGVRMLSSLAGPYAQAGVRFLPLGGVTVANMAEYLALPVVPAIGGTWLCDRKLIEAKDWVAITSLAAEAVAKAAAVTAPRAASR